MFTCNYYDGIGDCGISDCLERRRRWWRWLGFKKAYQHRRTGHSFFDLTFLCHAIKLNLLCIFSALLYYYLSQTKYFTTNEGFFRSFFGELFMKGRKKKLPLFIEFLLVLLLLTTPCLGKFVANVMLFSLYSL